MSRDHVKAEGPGAVRMAVLVGQLGVPKTRLWDLVKRAGVKPVARGRSPYGKPCFLFDPAAVAAAVAAAGVTGGPPRQPCRPTGDRPAAPESSGRLVPFGPSGLLLPQGDLDFLARVQALRAADRAATATR